MKINKFLTIVDYGSKKIRLSIFDKNHKKIYSTYENQISDQNAETKSYKINEIIRKAEKNISDHIEEMVVLYDDPKVTAIDLSIKKEFDQKIIVDENILLLVTEAKKLLQNYHDNLKIMHTIINKFLIDDKEYYQNLDKKLLGKKVIIDFKFVCIPNNKYLFIEDLFKKNSVQILNLFCTSITKAITYQKYFKNKKSIAFLDIGWERSTLTYFANNQIQYLKNIKIGGNHITKDINKIFNIEIDQSEKIKQAFQSSEEEFSYDKIDEQKNLLIKNTIGKDIDIDNLKMVILARVQEIIDLSLIENKLIDKFKESNETLLVLTGDGSKIFNKNSFHLKDSFNFAEINFYDESDEEICNAGEQLFYFNNYKFEQKNIKNIKKEGYFERFFNLFGR
tara:strand:+ start:486 stop:1664 length:1179 start_codon:yes stop_codon:yes gene_type:complete